jgi:2-oxoglutarate dehydrogenase complex, dehydrogenase (E1) component, and related enzymes
MLNAHPQYTEAMYRSWQADPSAVTEDWQAFFRGFDFALSNAEGISVPSGDASGDLRKEFAVVNLIYGYRDRGHTLSTTNPLKKRRDRKPRLDLEDYGLTEADLDARFAGGYQIGLPNATLREIIDRLKTIYCGNIGFESTHVFDKEKREWLRQRIERRGLSPDYGFSLDKKRTYFGKNQRRSGL